MIRNEPLAKAARSATRAEVSAAAPASRAGSGTRSTRPASHAAGSIRQASATKPQTPARQP